LPFIGCQVRAIITGGSAENGDLAPTPTTRRRCRNKTMKGTARRYSCFGTERSSPKVPTAAHPPARLTLALVDDMAAWLGPVGVRRGTRVRDLSAHPPPWLTVVS
jgi:hypothetical protein